MPIVWIGKVEAPESVLPNVPFDIVYREWFIVWPFKKYRIISRLTKLSDGDVVDCSYDLQHWWFWGFHNHIPTEWNGLTENEVYKIEVGYEK